MAIYFAPRLEADPGDPMTSLVTDLAETPQDIPALARGLAAGAGVGVDTSAGKALALLDAFHGPAKVLGVTDLAERANVAKSTAHRLLAILVSGGYLLRVGDRYCLTEHMFEIGNQVRECRPGGLRDRAMPYLTELFAQTRQTVHLAVLSGTDVLYLEKLFGHDAPRCTTAVGSRRPAHATALGKAMLAFSDPATVEANLRVPFRRYTPYTLATAGQVERALEHVASDGVATDHEESQLGVYCVARAIVEQRSGRAIAAISVCSASSTVQARYGRALLRAAEELSCHYSSRRTSNPE
jgi:DNA-binding IclR family transcriptional regulator